MAIPPPLPTEKAGAISKAQRLTLASGDGILCLALPRSGTLSLAKALHILGIRGIHHGLQQRGVDDWYIWGRAAYAVFPSLARNRNNVPPWWLNDKLPLAPYTRDDWDPVIGRRFRVLTDVGAIFGPNLIMAYPEAKVILCQRDFENWSRSFDDVMLKNWFGWFHAWLDGNVAGRINRDCTFAVLPDLVRGLTGEDTPDEARQALRPLYDEHYATIRRMVPKEQLLDFTLKDGWGPLCDFLGVPVPDVPFPRVNDTRTLNMILKIGSTINIVRALAKVCLVPLVAIIIAYFFTHRESAFATILSSHISL